MNSEVTTNLDLLNPIEKFLGKLNLSNIVIPSIRITDIIDIILVAIIIYTVIHWIKETRAWTLFRGLLVIILISVLSYYLHFYTLTWIIEKTLSVGIIAVIIIFQPELRKALEQIGTGSINSVTGLLQYNTESGVITSNTADEILIACAKMSSAKTGALIVIEKNVPMTDITNNSGVILDAAVSNQLLINIFEDKTPLHDGAVIIRDNRIASASCILPVTESEIGQELGTRHRAAVGGSEVSDSLIIVVSEETGKISISNAGKLQRGINETKLKEALYSLVESNVQRPINLNRLWKGLNKNGEEE
ncbi:MAG: diadenylate cyclase CdaA [Lachnospirales bacterium]